ncbi:MAG: SDR family NAD(P)-dependent oxidoreductase [Candidatus Nanopelagicaceae bacterium]
MSKIAIVTGGAKGIGYGSTKRLLDDGATVVMFDWDEVGLEQAIKDFAGYGERISGMKVDISSDAQVKKAIEEVGNKFGQIDYLVNCAGIQTYGTAVETSEETWDKTFDVNVKSMYLTAKYAIPFMRTAKSGSIVNISSVQSLANQKGVVAYAASKGAINSLTRAIAIDHAAEQIRCNAILPASVDTPMLRASARAFSSGKREDEILKEWGSSHPIGRMASIHEIGELVGFLCSEKASFITGSSYVIDGGLMTQVPVILPE